MYTLEGRDFFNNIRRSVKISHFVASVIPLALLVYFSVKYVYPYVTQGDVTNVPLSIAIVLVLAVVVSVLGLILTTRATNSSILSAQDLNKKLNSLFEITKQFRETLHLDVLLEHIMQSTMELTSAESGTLFLYDDNGSLKVKVTSGRNSEKIKNRIIQSGDGIPSWVAETGKSAMVNDVSKDNRYNPEFDREAGYTTRSVICVPLIHSNEIIGVLELRNKKQGDFTGQDEALLHSLADQASVSIAQNSVSEQQKSDFIHITEILVGIQDHIQDKKGHARRVANYANLIGKHMGYSEADLKKLYYACLFHDIGFAKIDMKHQMDEESIKSHPKLGHDMIKSTSLWRSSADIILSHHERYDGSGYPMAKKKDEIPLGARIIFVAETFDVLTSRHSYQRQHSPEAALAEIEAHAGSQFDPEIVQIFKEAVSEAGLIQ